MSDQSHYRFCIVIDARLNMNWILRVINHIDVAQASVVIWIFLMFHLK